MLGKDLDLARTDCDTALRRGPKNSAVYDSRALVWLRQGNFDKAIADYKEALDLQPKKASSLYGLGLAEIGKGLKASGTANITAAIELHPTIAEQFQRVGLTP